MADSRVRFGRWLQTRSWNLACDPSGLHVTPCQYHSEPNDGTEYTPQWMKMPSFMSAYQLGKGLSMILVQSPSKAHVDGAVQPAGLLNDPQSS